MWGLAVILLLSAEIRAQQSFHEHLLHKSNAIAVASCFVRWREHLTSQTRAKQHRESRLLGRSVLAWRGVVADVKWRAEKMEAFRRHQGATKVGWSWRIVVPYLVYLSSAWSGGGGGTTRPLPRNVGAEELGGDPTVGPHPKVWTIDQE